MSPQSAACASQGETGQEANPPLAGFGSRCPVAFPENAGGSGSHTASELESHTWDDLQAVVRSFRQAINRGERPAIEAYAPEGIPDRKAVLLELVHEELEIRIKAGEPLSLASYFVRFPELWADPAAVSAS